jgi:hypothetical protein
MSLNVIDTIAFYKQNYFKYKGFVINMFIAFCSKDSLLVKEERNKWKYQGGFEVDFNTLNFRQDWFLSKPTSSSNVNSLSHVWTA